MYNDIFVPYDPNFSETGGGVVCTLSWSALKSALEKAFAVKPNETLLGLKVHHNGISAYFEYKKIELPKKLPLPVPKRVREGISRAASSVYSGMTTPKKASTKKKTVKKSRKKR